MLHAVNAMRIKALPPLAFPLGFGQPAVIWHTRQRASSVRTMRRLEPPPVARLMHRDPEPQSVLPRQSGPSTYHIAVRAHVDRVPGLVLRVPRIETVMVIGKCDEKFGAGFFIALDQLFRVPIEQRPLRTQFFVAEL